MAGWDWLTKPEKPYTWGFALRVVLKALILFAGLNLLFALLNPLDTLGRISLYNIILTGRERLPYGENPAQSYNLSLHNLPAMFNSHRIAQPKTDDEFRVILIGDSATWGWLLENDETLAGHLNAAGHTLPDDRRLTVFNLGYPIMSLTKDLMLLEYALRYDPDMIVWLITLESFPRDDQLRPPIVQNNPDRIRALISAYNLNLDPEDDRLNDLDFFDQTLIGQRRALADQMRLQLYGVPWSLTGIDQFIPDDYDLRREDFDEDISWSGFDSPIPLDDEILAFDVLTAGIDLAANAGIPLLLVNEPMFISDGENSDLHYNFFYPRWAYDSYRQLLTRLASTEGWNLVDLWDILPPDAFTDSPVHTTSAGAQQLADHLITHIQALINIESP